MDENVIFLKEYYLDNYATRSLDYDKYDFVIKHVQQMIIDQNKNNQYIGYEKNFKLVDIFCKIKTYPGTIELKFPMDYNKDKIFEIVLDTLHDAKLDIFLNDIDLEEFKEQLFVWTYNENVITKEKLCEIIYDNFVRKERKKWICN